VEDLKVCELKMLILRRADGCKERINMLSERDLLNNEKFGGWRGIGFHLGFLDVVD